MQRRLLTINAGDAVFIAIAQLDYDTFAEEEDHEAMAELRQEISELVKEVEELEEELAVANDNEASERLDNHD